MVPTNQLRTGDVDLAAQYQREDLNADFHLGGLEPGSVEKRDRQRCWHCRLPVAREDGQIEFAGCDFAAEWGGEVAVSMLSAERVAVVRKSGTTRTMSRMRGGETAEDDQEGGGEVPWEPLLDVQS